jgi:Hypothetical protein (DUF2513)
LKGLAFSFLLGTIAGMKRDMDLVRTLLQRIEAEEPLYNPGEDAVAGKYHLRLLADAGLVEAKFMPGPNGEIKAVFDIRMTWQGHDFLDAARDETIWNKAKTHVLKPAASWSFSILLEWLKAEAKAKLLGHVPGANVSPLGDMA